jgi:hypothetical protein
MSVVKTNVTRTMSVLALFLIAPAIVAADKVIQLLRQRRALASHPTRTGD